MKRAPSIPFSSVIITAILAFSAGWFFAKNINSSRPLSVAALQNGSTSEQNLRIRDLPEIWDLLQGSYYDPSKLNREKLEYGAVKGFVAGVADPYTAFMTPEESKEFKNDLEGQLEGIGAELEMKDEKIIVVTPIKESPAQAAGIKPGDIIIKIDGKSTEKMPLMEAVRLIRGKKGTTVVLTIWRESLGEPKEFSIVRREITIESVTLENKGNGVFHLAINQFNDHTVKEFKDAIQKILLEKAKGIVLDLRGNGGGYLETSVEILSELLKGEKTAVSIRERDQAKNKTLKTNGSASIADIPLVVLINQGSASASEIVAGAVQDYKRGIVMGEKSFGKGSVQELVDLADGSRLRMTIAKWFTPLARTIDETGLTPDKEVKFTEEDAKAKRDPQLEEAIKYLQ